MKEEEQAALDKFVTLAESKGVPQHLCQGLGMYVLFGIFPGDYLTAFLSHNLRGVMGHGDDEAIAGLKLTWIFVYNNVPANCWGSLDSMKEWSVYAKKTGAVEVLKNCGR